MSWKPRKSKYLLPGLEGENKERIAAEAVSMAESESTGGIPGLIELCDEMKRQASALLAELRKETKP